MVRPRGPIYCALRAPTPSGKTTVVIIKTVALPLSKYPKAVEAALRRKLQGAKVLVALVAHYKLASRERGIIF